MIWMNVRQKEVAYLTSVILECVELALDSIKSAWKVLIWETSWREEWHGWIMNSTSIQWGCKSSVKYRSLCVCVVCWDFIKITTRVVSHHIFSKSHCSSMLYIHGMLNLIISDFVEFMSVRFAPEVKDTALCRQTHRFSILWVQLLLLMTSDVWEGKVNKGLPFHPKV